MEKGSFTSNPMSKIIIIGFILSLIISIGIGFGVVMLLGFNFLGVGLGVVSAFMLTVIIFVLLMFLVGIIAIIYFFVRDVGKDFQRTTDANYSGIQQTEVGKTTQTLNENKPLQK